MGDLLLGGSSTEQGKGAAPRATGTYLQLHLHPVHRQHLVLKEKRKGGEGRARLQDTQDPRGAHRMPRPPPRVVIPPEPSG